MNVRRELPKPLVEYFATVTSIIKNCDVNIDVLQGPDDLLMGKRCVACYTCINNNYEIIFGYCKCMLTSVYIFSLDEMQSILDKNPHLFDDDHAKLDEYVTSIYSRTSNDEVVPFNDIIKRINEFIESHSTSQA